MRKEILEILLEPVDPRPLEAMQSQQPLKVRPLESNAIELSQPALNHCKK